MIEEKIRKDISDYLGFHINEIINDDIDRCHIFGGAIRDSIADKPIHDIDILCLTKSRDKIEEVLKKNEYIFSPEVGKIDIATLYSEIHCIWEPQNWIKIIDGKIRIVQLIRPGSVTRIPRNYNDLDTPFYYLLGQVDLSCCAVHYSHQYGLKESVKGAIIQCQNHLFEIMKNNEMSSEPRIIKREQKLVQRGWKNLRNKYAFYNDEQNFENIKKRYMRLLKLDKTLNNKIYYMDPNKYIIYNSNNPMAF